MESVHLFRGGGADWAHLHDSAGDDHFFADAVTARLSGNGYYLEVNAFANVLVGVWE